jgi:hypothetical protein
MSRIPFSFLFPSLFPPILPFSFIFSFSFPFFLIYLSTPSFIPHQPHPYPIPSPPPTASHELAGALPSHLRPRPRPPRRRRAPLTPPRSSPDRGLTVSHGGGPARARRTSPLPVPAGLLSTTPAGLLRPPVHRACRPWRRLRARRPPLHRVCWPSLTASPPRNRSAARPPQDVAVGAPPPPPIAASSWLSMRRPPLLCGALGKKGRGGDPRATRETERWRVGNPCVWGRGGNSVVISSNGRAKFVREQAERGGARFLAPWAAKGSSHRDIRVILR